MCVCVWTPLCDLFLFLIMVSCNVSFCFAFVSFLLNPYNLSRHVRQTFPNLSNWNISTSSSINHILSEHVPRYESPDNNLKTFQILILIICWKPNGDASGQKACKTNYKTAITKNSSKILRAKDKPLFYFPHSLTNGCRVASLNWLQRIVIGLYWLINGGGGKEM